MLDGYISYPASLMEKMMWVRVFEVKREDFTHFRFITDPCLLSELLLEKEEWTVNTIEVEVEDPSPFKPSLTHFQHIRYRDKMAERYDDLYVKGEELLLEAIQWLTERKRQGRVDEVVVRLCTVNNGPQEEA